MSSIYPDRVRLIAPNKVIMELHHILWNNFLYQRSDKAPHPLILDENNTNPEYYLLIRPRSPSQYSYSVIPIKAFDGDWEDTMHWTLDDIDDYLAACSKIITGRDGRNPKVKFLKYIDGRIIQLKQVEIP